MSTLCPVVTDFCPDCGSEYKSVAKHISLSSCSWPELSTTELSLMEGLILGDGTVEPNGRLKVSSVRKEFIDWLHTEYPHLITSVRMNRTAEESAEYANSHNNPINVSSDPANYKAIYRAHFTVRPETKKLREGWYDGGKKIPDSVELTPMMAKIWYCGDGHLQSGTTPRISTRSKYKSDEIELFEDAGFDVHDNGHHYFSIPRQNLFEWMGLPPDGFEYKWPTEKVK